MRARTVLPAVAAAVLLAGAPVCVAAQARDDASERKDVRKELAEAAEAIRSYSAEKSEQASRRAKEALEALDARVDALQSQIDWDKMDQVAREKAAAAMQALQQQRKLVAERYESLKNSAPAAWERMRKGFSDAYDSLRAAWEKAEKELSDARKDGSETRK